jgi:hypothetical protein
MGAGTQIDFSDLGGKPAAQDAQGQSSQSSGLLDFSDLGGNVTGNPVQVVDKQGNVSAIPESQIDSARKQGKMPTAHSGLRMITPDGEITYALPQEVGKFLASGHVLVNKDGTFIVSPLPGEDNTDTMARAAKIGKAVTPEMLQAEKKTITPERIAANLVAAPVLGVGTLGAIAGAGAIPGAVSAGYSALTAPTATAATVGTGLLDEAGNEITREAIKYGPSLLRTIATSPAAVTAAKWLVGGSAAAIAESFLRKWVTGGKD